VLTEPDFSVEIDRFWMTDFKSSHTRRYFRMSDFSTGHRSWMTIFRASQKWTLRRTSITSQTLNRMS